MAAPQTEGNGKIIPHSKHENEKTLAKMIVGMGDALKAALPRHVSPERMMRIALTALRTTRKLDATTPASFLGCLLSCAQLGLEPNTPLGHAYLIPRDMKRQVNGRWVKVPECTLIIGYLGFVDLAWRSGQVADIYAYAVREGDDFRYQLGSDRKVHHVPSTDPDREKQLITHAYACAHLKNGGQPFEVMDRAKIEARRRRSAASDDGPWGTDYEAMARKTPIRELRKWIPQSAELARAAAIDEAPELGKSQASAFSEEVLTALKSGGLEPSTDAGTEEDGAVGAGGPDAATGSQPEGKDKGGYEPGAEG